MGGGEQEKAGVLLFNIDRASWEKKEAKQLRKQMEKLENMKFAPGVNSRQAKHKAWAEALLEVRYTFRVEASPYLPALSLGSPHTHSRDTQQVSLR